MDFWNSITLNVYSMIILIIIYFQAITNPEKEFLNHKLFIRMIKITFVMLAMDILSKFDGKPDTIYYFINHFSNFMIFMLNLVLPSTWILYVHYQIFQDEAKIKKITYPLLIINIINAFIVIQNHFEGWYYYIDANNVYHRGSLFWITPAITGILITISCILIFKNREKIGGKSYLLFILFIIPPFIAILLQTIFYGTSLILNSVTLSLMILLFTIQNRSIYIDFLTGLNNRKKIEAYFKTKIDLSTKEKSFSAIMIDLNGFKFINDTYGHDVGDQALKVASNLLKSSIRSNDFVGRLGGDEFTIILDAWNNTMLEEIVDRIKECFLEYNESSKQSYILSVSMGYAVYGSDSGMTVEEFQSHIDKLMYADKQAYKSKIF